MFSTLIATSFSAPNISRIFPVAAQFTTVAHTIMLLLLFLPQKSVADDLLDLLNIVETSRVYPIHQVVVAAVKQEMFIATV